MVLIVLFEIGSQVVKLRMKWGIQTGNTNFILPNNLLYINVFLHMLGSFLGSSMEFCNLRVKKTEKLIESKSQYSIILHWGGCKMGLGDGSFFLFFTPLYWGWDINIFRALIAFIQLSDVPLASKMLGLFWDVTHFRDILILSTENMVRTSTLSCFYTMS